LSLTEFNLIQRYFYNESRKRKDVVLGIGDDCALTSVPEGQLLATTTDTLVSQVHFPADTDPKDIAYKSIVVNLSDLAAMGAEPAWLNLSITLPNSNADWLKDFSEAFFEQLDYFGLDLIGGDTTTGPLAISITAMGFVPVNAALKRSGANAGDLIYVTNHIGDAGLGLAIAQGRHASTNPEHAEYLLSRLNRPTPRMAVGIALRNIASSAIDLSDGLAGDLPHILQASNQGAVIDLDKLPISAALLAEVGPEQAIQYALASGDDYELCFTVPEEQVEKMENALSSTSCGYQCIGRITGGTKIRYLNQGEEVDLALTAYQHFHPHPDFNDD
jgi:thiamine-monophosphate kinase